VIPPLKILHITTSDCAGGAGIAAYRLHMALRRGGVDSRMLVRKKGSSDPMVTDVGSWDVRSGMWGDQQHSTVNSQLPTKSFARLAVRARGWLGARIVELLGMKGASLNIFPTGLHRMINASEADVVHLHWINAEMISIKEVAKIKKPIVWTLHDGWPFLGAEHFPGWAMGRGGGVRECGGVGVEATERGGGVEDGRRGSDIRGQRPENGFNEFNVQRAKRFNAVAHAVNQYIFRLKKRAWKQLRVHFVAPSRWMAEQVKESELFTDARVTVIPNCIDLEVFKPMNQAECRRKRDLPLNKKLILFGADDVTDYRKGGDLLESIFKQMPPGCRDECELVLFGSGKGINCSGIKTNRLGHIFDDRNMAEVYNAADVYICPSRADNLPNTIAEALACGVPCAGFEIGGIPDMIDHQENGWLAKPYDTEDLCKGIEWILCPPPKDALKAASRRKAELLFSPGAVMEKHLAVYEIAT